LGPPHLHHPIKKMGALALVQRVSCVVNGTGNRGCVSMVLVMPARWFPSPCAGSMRCCTTLIRRVGVPHHRRQIGSPIGMTLLRTESTRLTGTWGDESCWEPTVRGRVRSSFGIVDLAVGLPAALLVEPREAAASSDPEAPSTPGASALTLSLGRPCLVLAVL
jgi:hypothetical protein